MKKYLVLLLVLLCTPLLFALLPSHVGTQTKTEICDNRIDDDDDKLVDCDDPDCKCPPPPGGTPCSPGYWKNHLTEFNQYCQAAADLPGDSFTTCEQLMTALTCKGSDSSCRRSAAAAALNTVSGCTE